MSDVFVSSSESEGLPNGVLEALASGIPVMLSNIPQHLEILEEVNNVGNTYSLGEIEELTRLMESNLEFEGDLQKSKLTMEKMGKLYLKTYEKILRG